MARKFLLYSALLVGTYLVVAHATDAGRLITSSAGGYATAVKALQGR